MSDLKLYTKLRDHLTLLFRSPLSDDAVESVVRATRRELDDLSLLTAAYLTPLISELRKVLKQFEYLHHVPVTQVAATLNALIGILADPLNRCAPALGLYETYVCTYVMCLTCQVIFIYYLKCPEAFGSFEVRAKVQAALFAGLAQLQDASTAEVFLKQALVALVAQFVMIERPEVPILALQILRWPRRNAGSFRLPDSSSNGMPLTQPSNTRNSFAISLSLNSKDISKQVGGRDNLFPVVGRKGLWVVGFQTNATGCGQLVLITKAGNRGTYVHPGYLNLELIPDIRIAVVQDGDAVSVFWEACLILRVLLSPADYADLPATLGNFQLHVGPVLKTEADAQWSKRYAAVATKQLTVGITGTVHSIEFDNIWGLCFPSPAILPVSP